MTASLPEVTPRWGLFGGTFNPVHKGHLAIAQAAMERFRLERMIFIPTSFPPHKVPADLASARDRIRMLELACRGRPEWLVSDLEIRRGGLSYTVETVLELRRELGTGAEFYLLVGADNLAEIGSWRRIEEVAGLCRIVAVTRPGFPVEGKDPASREWIAKLIGENPENLIGLDVPVSSTEIRERVNRGESIAGLVPAEVDDYIRQQGLYLSASNRDREKKN